jgi:hypothetical protein
MSREGYSTRMHHIEDMWIFHLIRSASLCFLEMGQKLTTKIFLEWFVQISGEL